jgi:hypothetical protein
MSILLTTDYLAAEAAIICIAAGRPELQPDVQDWRAADGSHQYQIAAKDPKCVLGGNASYGLAPTAEAALAEFAHRLGLAVPITFSTEAQQQQIIRLLNNPAISRQEKDDLLPLVEKLSLQHADEAISQLRVTIGDRIAPKLSVVAEVFTVRAAAA